MLNLKSQIFVKNIRNIPVAYSLLFIIAIGTYLRLIYIQHQFWMDELTTSWVIDNGFSGIFKRCWINNLSPLYYIFPYISKYLFGYSEWSLRLPCVIAGILLIPLIYLFTFKVSGSRKLSLLAAFIVSIDPSLIYYSLEVRPYSIVILLTTLHFYIFLSFFQSSRKIGISVLMAVLLGLIILMHYTAACIGIVEFTIALVYFIRNKSFNRQLIYSALIYGIIPLLMLFPFAEHIKYLFENNSTLGGFVSKGKIESVFVIQPHLAALILLPLISGFVADYIAKNTYNREHDSFFIFNFLIIWYFIPSLLYWFFTEIDIASVFYPRYLSWIIPAPIIGSVLLLRIFKSEKARILFITVLLFMSLKLYIKSWTMDMLEKGNVENVKKMLTNDDCISGFSWKDAVATINRSSLNPDKIVVVSNLVEAQKLKKNSQSDPLLMNYTLSTVNSIYKLNKKYSAIAVPVRSFTDIPDTLSNFILIAENLKKSSYEQLKSKTQLLHLSPPDALVSVIYIIGVR